LFIRISKKYPAYTLIELLVVLSIFIVIGGMTFGSFNGLQNTVKMNEYMLSLEQDIRAVQRSSMLLERNPDENWLYGLGIYFSGIEDGTGSYKVFKWCSDYPNYGSAKTKSELPAYDPSELIGGALRNAWLPYTDIDSVSRCSEEGLVTLAGYDVSLTPPEVTIATKDNIRYVVFESISGRAFFYGVSGELINYTSEGILVDNPVNFEIAFTPTGLGKIRKITIGHLSGKITLSLGEGIEDESPEPGGEEDGGRYEAP
jgi:type II secretory pathway pseudopilin PulG